jgi:uncharacterized OB-fold protein
MAYDKPLPQPNPDTKPFWDACRQHELRFQKCPGCAHVRWPASIICPSCYSRETEWIKASGKGTVYTYIVYHQAFHPAFEEELPYVTAIIELDEGPHFLSNIVDCDPESVYCDMPVELVWEDVDQGFSLPKFKPVSVSLNP